jgi:long-subunit fatty acid transport protein
MNYRKRILSTLALLVFVAIPSYAQFGYFEDAFRLGEFRSTGSARIMGIGGTQMSLGGDISNIHTNPAGLGFFRRSEFSITPTFGNWKSETNFLGQTQVDNTTNFAVPNLSLVISNQKDPLKPGSFRGGSFGISFNRTNHFNNQFGYFSDLPSDFSLLDFYANLYNINGEPPLRAPEGLPLDISLVFFDNQAGFVVDNDYAIGPPFADENIVTTGGSTQTSISYGANFDNKLFVGGLLGLSTVNYSRNVFYREAFFDDLGVRSLDWSLNESYRFNGFGANLGLGLIYKPIETVNLGLNFQSPTWFSINREEEADIAGDFFDINGNLEFNERAISDLIISRSTLNTPMRISGGATFFVGKSGFISADIDYVDYSSSRINSRDFNPNQDNQAIRNSFGSALNYRIGGEYRYNIWRVRAGYAYYGDPFTNQILDRSTSQITGGLGVRLNKMYVDFALSSLQFNRLYNSFPIINNGRNEGPISEIRNTMTNGMLTVGFNF